MDALAALLDVDHVDQQAGADPGRQATGDLLAVGVGRQQHPGRRLRLGQRGEHVDKWGQEVVLDGVGLGDVDLGGTGLLQPGQERLGRAGRADDDGGRFAKGASGVMMEVMTFFGSLLRCFSTSTTWTLSPLPSSWRP
ncbi:hypothetical protein MBOU_16020 [Mycobacterium bourgelatii]|uniref:Uncharacterized protein n=1 Tax=Mycobacterium bourgelatii TaxID=1273442 RepID=A0A7I9YLJ8_MYCBU|nr:hypothetical protein MBOU_16020 [Mycobacterium bourgelatii]